MGLANASEERALNEIAGEDAIPKIQNSLSYASVPCYARTASGR